MEIQSTDEMFRWLETIPVAECVPVSPARYSKGSEGTGVCNLIMRCHRNQGQDVGTQSSAPVCRAEQRPSVCVRARARVHYAAWLTQRRGSSS